MPKNKRGLKRIIEHNVDIKVSGTKLIFGEKGEKYAMSAWKGSNVFWECKERKANQEKKLAFAIQFEPGSDLHASKISIWKWKLHIPKKPKHPIYKYIIAVAKLNGEVLVMDPVLAPIPPEN